MKSFEGKSDGWTRDSWMEGRDLPSTAYRPSTGHSKPQTTLHSSCLGHPAWMDGLMDWLNTYSFAINGLSSAGNDSSNVATVLTNSDTGTGSHIRDGVYPGRKSQL